MDIGQHDEHRQLNQQNNKTRTAMRSCRDPETAVIFGRQVASAAGRRVSRLVDTGAAAVAAGAAVYPNS